MFATAENDTLHCATRVYAYDPLGRLTGVTDYSASSASNHTYDLAGNRVQCTVGVPPTAVSETYTHNKPDSMLHDLAGNVTNFVRGGVTHNLSWNLAGQLTQVSLTSPTAPPVTETYAYDALGRRVRTTTIALSTYNYQLATNTVHHIHDGAQVIADTAANGTVLRAYTWGPGIDNLLRKSRVVIGHWTFANNLGLCYL